MNTNFKTIKKEFVFWLETLGFSSHSIRKYGTKAKEFFEWLEIQNITSLNLIKQTHVKAFFKNQETRRNKINNQPLSAIYLNDYYTGIDKLLEFLHQMGAKKTPSPLNYRNSVNQQTRVKKIEPLTIEEIKILQQQIPHIYSDYKQKHREQKHYQLKLIFALFYGCGLRFREGYNLTTSDIDFNKKTLFVQQGKNYKDRIVPINDNIYNTLQDYIYNFRNQIKCEHNRLFLNSDTTLLRSLKDLQKSCEDEELKEKLLHFHILRHSIATHLLQNGMSVENISRFLGHSSLTSTQIYTHIINR